MENKNRIKTFLDKIGLSLKLEKESDFFGDYCLIYSNDIYDLKVVSDKSFITIDIKSINSKDNWYDLSLIRAFVYNEDSFIQMSDIDSFISFLDKENHKIDELFNKTNYRKTTNQLERISNERVKKMFPNL